MSPAHDGVEGLLAAHAHGHQVVPHPLRGPAAQLLCLGWETAPLGLASHGLGGPSPSLLTPSPPQPLSPSTASPQLGVKACGGQEGHLQGVEACLLPWYCCLKGLAPLLLPVNGILEGLEGKAGLEGQAGGCPRPRSPSWGEEVLLPLPALRGTSIQAFISSPDLGTGREKDKLPSLPPRGCRATTLPLTGLVAPVSAAFPRPGRCEGTAHHSAPAPERDQRKDMEQLNPPLARRDPPP